MTLNSNQIVEMITQARLGYTSSNHKFSKERLDMLAYTYPYHMQDNVSMLPLDCQKRLTKTGLIILRIVSTTLMYAILYFS